MLGSDKLESLAASAFSTLAEEHAADSFVGHALMIVEARTTDGGTAFYTFCTDKRQWIQRAMLDEARLAIEYEEVEVDGSES